MRRFPLTPEKLPSISNSTGHLFRRLRQPSSAEFTAVSSLTRFLAVAVLCLARAATALAVFRVSRLAVLVPRPLSKTIHPEAVVVVAHGPLLDNGLQKIANGLTVTSDASRGFEKLPIPFHNPIPDDPHTYSYFLYTPSQTLRTTTHFRQPWGSDHDAPPDPPSHFLFRVDSATSCDCTKGCGGDDFCPCLNLECRPSCKCDSLCGNRATQCGVNLRLKIVKHEKKGWGLYAA
ncbi:hypothetical protein SASPL_156564 [Salvia splendens]|uniref:Histone-lysine N-methyltransferase SETMAR n=1 Tax=Salvia splendens TaxID=180675 RepID=A0A8X8VWR1_SALSN|nr:hypothetical protein SASPL_156564 [Salvia splendens]